MVLGSIYRPPNTDAKKFNEEYCIIITKLKQESQNVVIGLDHNMDFLKSNKHENTQELINQNLDLGMIPTVTRQTRITTRKPIGFMQSCCFVFVGILSTYK